MGARPLQRVIDEDIKKPLSKMILFGELNEGGMVEVGLSSDIVPKLQVQFKTKKILEEIKTNKKINEKTS
jgi:ATP-dependent Clp protease ATP-binding subunit ClpA